MHAKLDPPSLASVLGSASAVAAGRIAGEGPAGRLPLTAEMLREEPSGNLFGLTQNVGMGWSPASLDGPPYRNDAAVVMRRLIRSLPTASGVMGVATCDKGLPATMLALAGCGELPGVIVPGGVTLPAVGGEDAGQVQSLGARFARDLVSLDYAATMGCRACGSAGGGCQFLGAAATSQVVAEALGLALPHSALAPSRGPVWLPARPRTAHALLRLHALAIPIKRILTQRAGENAMLGHAAVGGSTNLLLHIPAIAHAAGLRPPTVDDWIRVNRAPPRPGRALPQRPPGHPTVQVF